MNTLVQGYLGSTNDFQLNFGSKESHVYGYKLEPDLSGSSSSIDESSNETCVPTNGGSPTVDESSSSEGESFKENDHSDAILRFIRQMLMEEEDLENKPCMLNDCLALQATEKSLYDVLNNNLGENPNHHFTIDSSREDSTDLTNSVDSHLSHFESLITPSDLHYPSSSQFDLPPCRQDISPFKPSNSSREKKNRYREDSELIEDERSNKQLANNVGETEALEMYDEVLLCSNSKNPLGSETEQIKSKQNRGRPKGGKKQGMIKEVVDLRSLLMQCAQAVASHDTRSVFDMLAKIRQHSSPNGDGTERLAHYFANGLEARVAGTGMTLYASFSSRISAAEMLRGYQTFLKACPFRKISNLLANKTIAKLASKATTVHIIDFGILYGFQWPCLIQAFSERPGGPPKLRITGIDFPQTGFRPAERVEDTGRRLAKYCERFGVPFEYNAIAQKWETINVEDMKIEKNELVVVNSLYRFQNVLDETVMVNSPRDAVLSLIRRMSPDMFIHGVVNGTYNTPFFITRFREAMFHFSSLFDMFESAVPKAEAQSRKMFEEEVFGKDAMNIIACEGTERIDRPETYKQWQARNVRAGFRQMSLDREIVKHVRNKVKMDYHKDFSVDEDGKWMLQGWKGRVIHGFSCWQPAHN